MAKKTSIHLENEQLWNDFKSMAAKKGYKMSKVLEALVEWVTSDNPHVVRDRLEIVCKGLGGTGIDEERFK